MTDTSREAIAAHIERISRTPRLLVALDFDGTLAPLQDEPMKSRMIPEARHALDQLLRAPHTTVALVSGRTLHDLKIISEHDASSSMHLAGSHGAEYWLPGTDVMASDGIAESAQNDVLRDALRTKAEHVVQDMDGAWIEPKQFGFGLHTRMASDLVSDEAIRDVGAIVATHAPSWRRRTGHNILEYAYRHEGKDTAIAALRAHLNATAVLFAGDDVTDEDALATLASSDLGVRVGEGATCAHVRVRDAKMLADVLSELAQKRTQIS